MLEELLKSIRRSEPTLKPNYLLIPVTDFKINEEGMNNFNELFNYYKSLKYNVMKRTQSGGICKRDLILPAWSVKSSSTSVEMVILDKLGCARIRFREVEPYDGENTTCGRRAFIEFKNHLHKYGIELCNYEEKDGYKYKEQIIPPLIKMADESIKDVVFENAHHIDFHNSYPAGLCNTHPEFREAINELYLKRKQNPVYKAILNYSIGFMQSEYCGYKYSKLSRDAINDNYDRIINLASKLVANGSKILLYNTDGIWYSGNIYHGDGEGSNLGDWSNDHVNCKFRAKSNGAYEFIEDGKYYPVVRGKTRLDNVKPRNLWEWGDIYIDDSIVKYKFTFDGGIEEYEGQL